MYKNGVQSQAERIRALAATVQLPSKFEMHQRSQEFNDWKTRSAQMYDVTVTNELRWPSLTVEWLPTRDEDNSAQKMILGTHVSNDGLASGELNYLILAKVQMPLANNKCHSVIQEINHLGEVNRARYMPHNLSIIATKTGSADVHLFDCNKHPSEAPPNGVCDPDLKLKGHSDEGYGLSWSTFKPGHLLSCANDALICLWDVNAAPENAKTMGALQKFEIHVGIVQDVAWHMKDENLFGSVGNDKYLHIWDLRSASTPVQSVMAHEDKVNCLSFNPFNELGLATGSSDNTVKLFDRRIISNSSKTFSHHKADVIQVAWSPTYEKILASGCHGRKLFVWDLSRTETEQLSDEEAPSQLLFDHVGHTSRLSDFSWNPCEDRMVASVAKDNVLQIWQMAEGISHMEL